MSATPSVTRRRFITTTAVAVAGTSVAKAASGDTRAAPTGPFNLSGVVVVEGRGKSPFTGGGILKGTFGTGALELVGKQKSAVVRLILEYPDGILLGNFKICVSCQDGPAASGNGVFTTGTGRFAGVKGTFSFVATPKGSVPGFSLQVSGRLY